MFTGIIQGITKVVEVSQPPGLIAIHPHPVLSKTKLGGSIAVNGVCLTLAKRSLDSLSFEVMPETIRKTNLSFLQKNDLVNIEPALRVGDELGGHIVQGHIDNVGTIKKILIDSENTLVEIDVPKNLLQYIIEHGSVALDGISLTVARLTANTITVSLIAETLKRTIWKKLQVGQKVNIEVDMFSKYIKNFIK